MSWERKWKQFQTADRIDEASKVKEKISVPSFDTALQNLPDSSEYKKRAKEKIDRAKALEAAKNTGLAAQSGATNRLAATDDRTTFKAPRRTYTGADLGVSSKQNQTTIYWQEDGKWMSQK